MVSLITLTLDLISKIKYLNYITKVLHYPRTDGIIVVRRFPPRKVLRAHELGLALGLLFTLLAMCLNVAALISGHSWYTLPLIGLLFICGTLFGGPFVILIGLFLFIFLFISVPSETLMGILEYVSQWYFGGYMFGAIFATLYNDFVFLQLVIFQKHLIKFVFAFDRNKKINVIKSPLEKEEFALLGLIKPMIYYTQKIAHSEDIDECAKKVIDFILQAYEYMSETDRNQLKRHLPVSEDNSMETKIEKLKQHLLENHTRGEAINNIEEHIEPLVEKYLQLKSRKLYNYRLNHYSPHPYTIVFIANPKILKPKGNTFSYESDPILNNIDLFLRSVEKALFSFETNEVLGRPEIWPYIRIIAVFDENLAVNSENNYALVRPVNEAITLDGIVAENLLAPSEQIWADYKNIISSYASLSGFSKTELDVLNQDTDVIFAMSACKEHNRSTALYTDYEATSLIKGQPQNQFEFHLDSNGTKNDEIYFPTVADAKGCIHSEHESYSVIPGRVALNVLGATMKSYIHEFAHAMSSAFHGAIVDEYFDHMDLHSQSDNDKESNPETFRPFYVNRIERKRPDDGRIVPVHKIFAQYKGVNYYSDREHPSSEEFWTGYFPNRKSSDTVCTMDRGGSNYRFDQLISDFMYDRLISKINRK